MAERGNVPHNEPDIKWSSQPDYMVGLTSEFCQRLPRQAPDLVHDVQADPLAPRRQELVGHRSGDFISNLAVVHTSDGEDAEGCAGEEGLVRGVEVVGLEVVLDGGYS